MWPHTYSTIFLNIHNHIFFSIQLKSEFKKFILKDGHFYTKLDFKMLFQGTYTYTYKQGIFTIIIIIRNYSTYILHMYTQLLNYSLNSLHNVQCSYLFNFSENRHFSIFFFFSTFVCISKFALFS